jgi:hypothetical protein
MGKSDPVAFAKALVDCGFNPGEAPGGNPDFVKATSDSILSARRRLK